MIFIIGLLILLFLVIYYLLKPEIISTPKTKKKESLPSKIMPPIRTEIYTSSPSITNEASQIATPAELTNFALITDLAESDQPLIDKIVEITQSMPRPHSMLRSLTHEIENSDKLYDLVKSDPEIAAKILQAVNSSGFYLTQKITRLNHAILYLGTNMVKSIALQCIITTRPHSTDKDLALVLKKIWAHGFLASSLAFLFAKNLNLNNADELATQTLLAYIGNLAIISYKPELAHCFIENKSLFERVQIEQAELGVNSAVIGGALAASWQLPQELILGIHDNLMPLGIPPAQSELPVEHLRAIVLCYICCRAAEIIFKDNLLDIADVHLLNQEQMELFYLPEYINMTGLQQFLSLQQKPTFRNEANKLIEKIKNPEPAKTN
jgi:HD-like signal output (HDOD) protein